MKPADPNRSPNIAPGSPHDASAAWARLLASSPPSWVPAHCKCVAGLAAAMCDCAAAAGLQVNRELVVVGALLHDIGRSVTQDVRHASLGAELLRRDGWPGDVVLCVERHTGGGIDAEEAARLGLPAKDYTPQTLEEKIVCHADNLYSGSKRIGLEELEAKYRAKGLDRAWGKIRRLHEELGFALQTDCSRLAPATV